tara:strand:- start:290 stop:1144 length:855 start_codon:yes stop_codon:yes gene_type:complete
MLDFYILGDMGSGEEAQKSVSRALQNHIGNKNTFVCGLGDNIYEEGCTSINDKQFFEKFEKPYQGISDKIKFYMSLGNHDYGQSSCGKGNSIYQIKYGKRSKKQGKKWIMPHNYYTFRKNKGNVVVEFFVIDTNMLNLTEKEIEKQMDQISQKINKSKAHWKIVYGHHTWRSVAGHGNADDELEEFLTELFTKSPFDVYMCGHDHNKQIIRMDIDNKDVFLIVCGTGGKVYDDDINIDCVRSDSELEFLSNNLGFGYLKAFQKKLEIIFLDKNNVEELNYIIKK